jgi:hypothetical protein
VIHVRKESEVGGKQPRFTIHIDAQLYNNSASKEINLTTLAALLIEQAKCVFTFSKHNYSCAFTMHIECIASTQQISKRKLLLCIQDEIRSGIPAQTDFKGLRVAISKGLADAITSKTNTRTFPHELGHAFGWDHPHARGKFESVNLEADKIFEQGMSEEERQKNLMSQTWYIQNTGKSSNDGVDITFGQLELLYKNFQAKKLNNNYHIKGSWLWKRIV